MAAQLLSFAVNLKVARVFLPLECATSRKKTPSRFSKAAATESAGFHPSAFVIGALPNTNKIYFNQAHEEDNNDYDYTGKSLTLALYFFTTLSKIRVGRPMRLYEPTLGIYTLSLRL